MRSRRYPTEEYLRSIMKWIQGHGVADAQLPVTNRVSSDDMLPIIQGNRNKIINVTAFASYVGNIISGNTAASLVIEDGELVLYSKLGVSMGSVSLKDYIDTLEIGTTYTAGTGIVIDGEAISIDDSYVSSLISSDSTVETAIRSLFAASSGLSYNSSSGTYSINEDWLEDYVKDYVSDNVSSYTLPVATSSTLGGVKVGSYLTIDEDGTLDMLDIDDFYTKYLTQDPSLFASWCIYVLGNETSYTSNTSLVYDEDDDSYTIGSLIESGSQWNEETDNKIYINSVFLTHKFTLEDDDENQIQVKMTPNTQPHYYLHEGDGVNVVIEEDTSVTWSVDTSWMSENYASASDKRLKTDVKDFNALEIVNKLSPVSFKWNEKAHEISENYNTENTNYGLIAQDSDGVIDGFVDKGSKEDDMWAIKYQKLVPILLKAIQELEAKNKNLEERLNILEK